MGDLSYSLYGSLHRVVWVSSQHGYCLPKMSNSRNQEEVAVFLWPWKSCNVISAIFCWLRKPALIQCESILHKGMNTMRWGSLEPFGRWAPDSGTRDEAEPIPPASCRMYCIWVHLQDCWVVQLQRLCWHLSICACFVCNEVAHWRALERPMLEGLLDWNTGTNIFFKKQRTTLENTLLWVSTLRDKMVSSSQLYPQSQNSAWHMINVQKIHVG